MSEFEMGRELERALARIAECERLIGEHQTMHAGLPDHTAALVAIEADLAEAAADLAAMQAELDEAAREPEPEPEDVVPPEPKTEPQPEPEPEVTPVRTIPMLHRRIGRGA